MTRIRLIYADLTVMIYSIRVNPWPISLTHRRHLLNRRLIFFGISLITLSVLMLELSLTRLFSATMYYHFAFMAISLALFGSGASGVFIYIVQRGLKPERTGQWLSAAAMLFALSNLFSLYVILANPL